MQVLEGTLVAVSVYKDVIRRLWAGNDSVNTWSQCIYWMTGKPWRLFRAAPPLPDGAGACTICELLIVVYNAAAVQAWLICLLRLKAEHWEDTGSDGMWAPEGFRCLSVNKPDPCDTPLPRPIPAPDLTGLPPSRKNLCLLFPPTEKTIQSSP